MISNNAYFDDNVKSLAYTTEKGSSTLGVMNPGEYEFATSKHETMRVIEGQMVVKLPDTTEWATFNAGEAYEIDADKKFQVKVSSQTSYLCTYK
ncbi:pyrimidine/purine nucleoside phosphorylase [Tamlana agarivorans]|uniref:Pyrimidine/purine nucleoside phosphorylase n=1 Tax=Pseudotamlana agarivorans TaxID=481183 RepID=A0ACC5U8C1_9FLAO|nr:pyrimidine/purine nucleoside phosphorylase [Tamlana agarivorans]MBU2950563.1 pyrimidine/purine nucleoside phosphorylase [Tamlana agarivorans]